jgi:ABC-2 type transport system ATP-binding protein
MNPPADGSADAETVLCTLILEQKKAGKTILLSSHMFEEVERTCDEVIIIKDGR